MIEPGGRTPPFAASAATSEGYGLVVGDESQLQLPARLNHGLRARRIAFAGKLDQNFVVAAARESDGRLGKPERVDAARDDFERLVHGVFAEVGNNARLHGQQVAVRFSRGGGHAPNP